MTLEEAKKHLNNNVCAWKHNSCAFKSEIVDQINKDYEAIDTVLKELEDSIPKEKVRELLDEQYELYNSKDQAKTDFSRMYTLEELLGE